MSIASLTLYRQAVTAPKYASEGPQHDQAAAIVAEIAERLEELDGIKREFAADLVMQLAGIAGTSRKAFRITVQLLHGNMDDVLASYQEQANRRGVTKQDVHWEFTQEVERLRSRYPQLYGCIKGMRAQALQHEDPIARNEVANAGGGME
jgi:hypothetical protein